MSESHTWAGRRCTHGLRVGPNTDMMAAKVPLRERNRRDRWSEGANTADTVYDRTYIVPEDDPLSQVPLGGFDG